MCKIQKQLSEVFYKNIVLKNFVRFTWKNFIKKETLAQVFSCKFCGISKNIFFTKHLWANLLEIVTLLLSVNM